ARNGGLPYDVDSFVRIPAGGRHLSVGNAESIGPAKGWPIERGGDVDRCLVDCRSFGHLGVPGPRTGELHGIAGRLDTKPRRPLTSHINRDRDTGLSYRFELDLVNGVQTVESLLSEFNEKPAFFRNKPNFGSLAL